MRGKRLKDESFERMDDVRKKVIANNKDLVEELAFNTFLLIKES